MAEEWISLREFSRRREVALSAVQKAIESGRVSAVKRDAGGRLEAIEYVRASSEWNAHTDPVQAARSGKILEAPGQIADLVAAAGERDGAPLAPSTAAGDKDPHGYYEARADREKTQAKLAELELLQELGRLVDVEEMRRVAQRRYRTVRDKLLNVPDRVSAILAAEKDPARVHAALTSELKRVLHELSDDAHAEAAGGVAERVAA